MKKFSKGMSKYIRKHKSELRKQYIDLEEQQKAIKEFLESLRVEKK
jgi:hypothetical protein